MFRFFDIPLLALPKGRASRLAGCLFCLALPAALPAAEKAPAAESKAPGDLVFEHTRLTLRPDPGQQRIRAYFPFANRGAVPVQVLGVETCCGAYGRALGGSPGFEPGQAGEIEVVYDIGARRGRHTSQVVVEISSQPAQVLELIVDIPLLVSLEPGLLTWVARDPPNTQTALLRLHPDAGFRVTGLAVSPGFTGSLQPLDAPRLFRVAVTPESTERAIRGFVRLKVEGEVAVPLPSLFLLVNAP